MMKLVVLSAIVAVAYGAVLSDPRQAKILRLDSEIAPEGSYQYAYETENGIAAQEQGTISETGPNSVAKSVQGGYSWTAPDSQSFQISYVADENGYQPSGNALPTPPPVPAAILRSLEYIAAHPQQPVQPQQLVRRY